MSARSLFLSCLIIAVTVVESAAQLGWKVLPNAPVRGGRHEDVFFINANTGWVVNLAGEVWRTTDGGDSWQMQELQPEIGFPNFRSVGFADATHGWAGTLDTDLLFATSDGGATWRKVVNIPDPKPAGVCGLAVVDNQVIYGAGRFDGPARVIKSIDGGASWRTIDMASLANALIDIYFFTQDTGFVVGGTSGAMPLEGRATVLSTFDGGNTWQRRHSSTRRREWGWKLFFPTRRTGFVSIETQGDNSYCLKTTNGGLTWEELLVVNASGGAQAIGFATEDLGWIGGRGQPRQSIDGGMSWGAVGFLDERINRIRMLSDTLGYAVGHTVYKYSRDSEVAVAEPRSQSLLSDFALKQNYPNPFNPSTNISFRIARHAHVELKIFDLAGNTMRILVDRQMNVGEYQVSFEAFNLPSGIYFYRLTVGEFVRTRKMVLAR